ncbi:hypothetical protein BBO99_00001842 [Phytophthora kernoviae]|uniref:Cyclic nucleotide-binding domain-containing protein n=2 Tax=Phytophthora kernoviae TaxID=325452 RepID=A0A3R7G601_9STRA|nr:hypothetical protein G195_001788 [Phytophthora kernoviae 00238/432]KAG2531028.1 hypothetical protein JM16_001359 [Phytophthora kernoviae]KAG2531600.1 hypothetical protein JM18_001621 [Phytophthora kernoviae]RLN31795.1 hypothetical protein BBI17_001624 [Phytophthora kernoviae]RLN83735.1 hypothetical protein BBO99_00001842 [Phytophthora kernoviae]
MHIPSLVMPTAGQPSFCGDDDWVRKHLANRDDERAQRNSPTGGHPAIETVRFNRAQFTSQIQEFLDADVSDGFVIGLKRRREFALQLCEDYKMFTEPQKLELVLALAVDLGVRDLAYMMKTLPSIKRSGLVLNVAAAALGFSRKNDPNISKSVKRGLVPLAEQFFLMMGTIQPGPMFLLNLRVDLGILIERHREKLPKSSVAALELLDVVMRDLFATQGSMRFRRIDLSSQDLAAFVLKNERVHQKISDPEWHKDTELVENIRDVMTVACARYILFERKKDKILDPVANFHLQNGAQVEQINFMADTTPSSLATSLEVERLKDQRNTPLFAKVYRAGEVISARGSLPTAIYFIASGRVRISSAHPYTLCEGHTFGERGSLKDEPVPFTVLAETVTHLLLLPYNDVKAIQRESSVLSDYVGSDPRVWQQQLYMSFHGSKL